MAVAIPRMIQIGICLAGAADCRTQARPAMQAEQRRRCAEGPFMFPTMNEYRKC
jgi:hypothetical protein